MRERCIRFNRGRIHPEAIKLERPATSAKEVATMINLLIFVGAIIVAFRLTRPLLRMAIDMVVKLISFGFLIAIGLLLFVAILSHGMFI
jgi:hypothetical protein